MEPSLTPITAFTKAIAAGRLENFDALVRTAYIAGVSREALLMPVYMVRAVLGVSSPLVAQAFAAVNRWSWIEVQRRTHWRASLLRTI